MLNKRFVFILAFVSALAAQQAFAGSTGWFNYSDPKIRAAKFKQAEKSLAFGQSYTRIRCRMQDGQIWMNINTSRIFSEGWYGIMYGATGRVDKAFAQHRAKGARIRARTDLETKGGSFTCLSWHRGT